MTILPSRTYLVRNGASAAERVTLEIPPPEAHQVRYRTLSTGICRSQLNQIEDAKNLTGDESRLLGHEALVQIESVGSRVSEFETGDLALIGWVPKQSHLHERKVEGVRFGSSHGWVHSPDVFTWTEVGLCDVAYVYSLKDYDPEGHPITPDFSILGCATITGVGAITRTLGVAPEHRVGVFGVGGVGSSAISGAVASGAACIVAIDVDDAKLEFATSLGATHVVNSAKENVVESIQQITDGHGLDRIADCVGLSATIDAALQSLSNGICGTSRGGALAVVGVPRSEIRLDLRSLQLREQIILGSFGGSTVVERDLPGYLVWVSENKLPLHSHVTLRVSFDSILEGATQLAQGKVLGRAIAIDTNWADISSEHPALRNGHAV